MRFGRILSFSRFVRTDCTINKGDSGGPLFDFEGKVIGINGRIYPPLDQNHHAPIDAIRASWDRMLAGERWFDERRGRDFRPGRRSDEGGRSSGGGAGRGSGD